MQWGLPHRAREQRMARCWLHEYKLSSEWYWYWKYVRGECVRCPEMIDETPISTSCIVLHIRHLYGALYNVAIVWRAEPKRHNFHTNLLYYVVVKLIGTDDRRSEYCHCGWRDVRSDTHRVKYRYSTRVMHAAGCAVATLNKQMELWSGLLECYGCCDPTRYILNFEPKMSTTSIQCWFNFEISNFWCIAKCHAVIKYAPQ